jgi:Ca2+-binding EF-hand superfamily protein
MLTSNMDQGWMTEPTKAKTNLGKAGYNAMLVNLPPSLKQYEGATTRTIKVVQPPDGRRSSGVYHIEAVHDSSDGAPVHLSLRGKFLEPMIDRSYAGGSAAARLEMAKLSKSQYYKECMANGHSGTQQAPGDSANNRSSVKIAHQKFVQQLKKAIKALEGKKGQSVQDVLVEMDDDKSGSIDKEELLLGAHTLGISVAPHELEMIWPLFGPFDAEGAIEIDRFIKICGNRSKATGRSQVKALDAMDSRMLTLQKMNRKLRIDKKSQLKKRINELSVDLQSRTLAKLQERGLSAEKAFAFFDTDGGGTIDKQEFYVGLKSMGIRINDDELRVIWPMFNLDHDGDISAVEWAAFCAKTNEWSYLLTEDRFSNMESSTLGACQDEFFKKSEYGKRLQSTTRARNTNGVKTPARRPQTGKGMSRLYRGKPLTKVNSRTGRGGSKKAAGDTPKPKKKDDHFVSPRTHTAFGGSGLLYRRESITRGVVIGPVFD